jgi:hypothetical protein
MYLLCTQDEALLGFILDITTTNVKTEEAKMDRFEMYKDAKGEYRWKSRASNLRIVADLAEVYRSKSYCKHGINFIKKEAFGVCL